MLRTAIGPAIATWLEDRFVVEVMLNPDGRLWIDRLSTGLDETQERLTAADGERIVWLVAHHVGAEAHPASPRVSAVLPETGERFEGLLPPVVAAPIFAIRKPAVAVFTLDDYVAAGIMTRGEADALRRVVADHHNILVAGGTSTGKTTLANELLAEVAEAADRVVLIDDIRELRCRAANLVALRTNDGVASLSELVRSSLRLGPERIPIGEVRGAEALDLLKAWGTGHPGGIGTIHAGTAIGALRRLEQLIQEAVVTVPRGLIAVPRIRPRSAGRGRPSLAGRSPRRAGLLALGDAGHVHGLDQIVDRAGGDALDVGLLGRRLIVPWPNSYGGELSDSKVVQGSSVEACADVPELLEFYNASFDEVALRVCPLRVRSGLNAVDLRRYAGLAVLVLGDHADPVGVIGTIGEHDGPRGRSLRRSSAIGASLACPGGELELNRQAIADDADVQLGRRPPRPRPIQASPACFFGRPPADARA